MTPTKCQRCGTVCIGSESGNNETRLLKRAKVGLCAHCGVIQLLQVLDNMHGHRLLPPGSSWRQALALPHIQRQFESVMRAGNADATPAEINWERVIELWDIAPAEKGRLF